MTSTPYHGEFIILPSMATTTDYEDVYPAYGILWVFLYLSWKCYSRPILSTTTKGKTIFLEEKNHLPFQQNPFYPLYKRSLLLLLLSHFSPVRLCVTPETAAHQAPPSLGFSRQEHWSGLPFPSPVHESEKWMGSRSVVSDSVRPHGLQPTRLLRPWDFPGKSTGVGCHCLLPKDL